MLEGAAIVLARSGRVIAQNGEADSMLRLPYVCLRARCIQFRETRDQAAFLSALEGVLFADDPEMRAFQISGSGTPLAIALIIPLTAILRASRPSQKKYALLSIRHAFPEPIPHGLLRRLFGLTPSECEIADALVSGLELASAARKLGISTTTARNQMSAVMGKVGAHRQAELVARLAAILPRLKIENRPLASV
jgi:DNA-binding CsgD family transcriptional regulator